MTDAAASSPPSLVSESPLEMHDSCPDTVQIGIDPQCAPKALERGQRVVLLQVALPHARGGTEVVRVEFECLMAIADGFVVPAQAEVGHRPLIPRLRKPRRLGNQLRRA